MNDRQTSERELPLPGAWLACPRCERAPLFHAAHCYRCGRCQVEFPVIDGIPWLFAEPQAWLDEWRSRITLSLQELEREQTQVAAAAGSAMIGTLTRQRLELLAKAKRSNAETLKSLLAPLRYAAHAARYETNLAFRPQVPWDHGLMTYAYNVYRDWSWGDTENEASYGIVRDALAGTPPRKVLVLGAGAGRLAYDLHMNMQTEATLVFDFNPFFLLLASRVMRGDSMSLYEFPLAPRSLHQSAVLRTFTAPQPCRDGIYYVLADAQRPPFPPGSFDAIVTPWLVDILPEPFEDLCRRLNRLLVDGGRWINFGSLSFHVADPALQYSPEECAEIINATGFEAPALAETTMPYLSSPASRHGRLEQVLSWSTTKRHEVASGPLPELLPDWLVDGQNPVPLLDVFRTQAPATRIRAYILSLIDGRRSLNDIVRTFDQHQLMSHEQAEATIRSLLVRMYNMSRRNQEKGALPDG